MAQSTRMLLVAHHASPPAAPLLGRRPPSCSCGSRPRRAPRLLLSSPYPPPPPGASTCASASSNPECLRNRWELLANHAYNFSMKSFQHGIAAFLVFIQISFALPLPNWSPELVPPANAVLYSPNTKVPRSGEVALRRAIPANPNMKTIQDALEDIFYLLRIPQRKPFGTMEANVKKAIKIAVEGKDSILSSFPAENKEKGSLLYTSLLEGKGGLQNLIELIKQNDADKISVCLASSLDTLAELEVLQAPGLSFLLPDEYLKYPRGVVEFTIEKGDQSTFFPTGGGEPKNTATIQVVVDGYSAPLTSGNFVKLVSDGAYDGVKLKCTNQAVLPDNELANVGYNIPLELMPSGQFEPLYKTMLSVQDGELPVLPLSVYGAVAMSHSVDSEEYSSPNQFFFYLYDKRSAGLGGLSFDEGQFSVFGSSGIPTVYLKMNLHDPIDCSIGIWSRALQRRGS